MTLRDGITTGCVLTMLAATACVGPDSTSRPESTEATSAPAGGTSSSSPLGGGAGSGGLATSGGSNSVRTSSTAAGLPIGGATSSGGSTVAGGEAAGGVVSTGGTPTGSTSSTSATTGGASNAGASSGGSRATGGATATVMQTSTGGAATSGGSSSVVVSGTGGLVASGGTLATGGGAPIGGTPATGGASATGGALATGGQASTGGTATTGGAAVTGGSSTTGGSATDYSGLWSGLTTQGKLASFRVYANAVTQFTIDWILPKVSDTCSPAGATTSTFGTPAPIASNATFTKGPVSANPTSLLFSGQFNSSTAASGTVGVSYSVTGCNSSSTLSWTAQKVVCGDGIMQWPETCDPGTALPTSKCSDLCQLFPVSETESNDNIGLANGPYTDDTLVSASISTSDDVDVFAVRNTLAGSVSIEFETHGETVGSCDNADTFMQVARSDGTIIAADDDGSRMLYCSYAMVSVAAGETVYVAVSSSILQPIARYQLHIKFPHS